ncbi:hypothetical protein CC80DRAFT_571198, partial [Byssothecium circinans]
AFSPLFVLSPESHTCYIFDYPTITQRGSISCRSLSFVSFTKHGQTLDIAVRLSISGPICPLRLTYGRMSSPKVSVLDSAEDSSSPMPCTAEDFFWESTNLIAMQSNEAMTEPINGTSTPNTPLSNSSEDTSPPLSTTPDDFFVHIIGLLTMEGDLGAIPDSSHMTQTALRQLITALAEGFKLRPESVGGDLLDTGTAIGRLLEGDDTATEYLAERKGDDGLEFFIELAETLVHWENKEKGYDEDWFAILQAIAPMLENKSAMPLSEHQPSDAGSDGLEEDTLRFLRHNIDDREFECRRTDRSRKKARIETIDMVERAQNAPLEDAEARGEVRIGMDLRIKTTTSTEPTRISHRKDSLHDEPHGMKRPWDAMDKHDEASLPLRRIEGL